MVQSGIVTEIIDPEFEIIQQEHIDSVSGLLTMNLIIYINMKQLEIMPECNCKAFNTVLISNLIIPLGDNSRQNIPEYLLI